MEEEMAEEMNIYFGASDLVTALGGKEATLQSMAEGVCGLRHAECFGMYAGLISGIPRTEGFTRFGSLVVDQVGKVLDRSGLSLSDPSVQLVISTTKGDVELLADKGDAPVPEEAFLPFTAARIAAHFRCAHRPVVISNACISGVSAFVVARDLMEEGRRHVVIVGCDVLSEFVTSGFASFKSVSPAPCRPYDAARDGLTLGEACACVLLTKDIDHAVRPLVRLAGGAVTNDANHISGPSRTGDGLYHAIHAAMQEAGVGPEQVAFVNTHGTATLYNDEMESKAVAWAGLEAVPLNGLKGYIGHTLGASGVVDAVICAEELRAGRIFGTLGYREPGTSVPLQLSPGSRPVTGTCCVKTASGFGGCNAAIVLSAVPADPGISGGGSLNAPENRCTLPKRTVQTVREYELPQSELPFATFIRDEYRKLADPNMKFFKMSGLCKAVYVAAENLLRGFGLSDYDPVRRAVILANASSSLEADREHQRIVDLRQPEGASPAVFVYTLPNVAAGELCIRHKFQGDNTFFIEAEDSGLAEEYARRLIGGNRADLAVCGWCDKLGETWNVHLKLLIKK